MTNLTTDQVRIIANEVVKLMQSSAENHIGDVASSDYYAIVTNVGKDLINDAYNSGTVINITDMAIGDSHGAFVEPDPSFTALVNEFGRQAVESGGSTDAAISAAITVKQDFAGNVVREFGLFDDKGNLIVYGSYPPALIIDSSGSTYMQLQVAVDLYVENAKSVNIVVNPTIDYATEIKPGLVIISNKYDGDSKTKAVTEYALREGLRTRYGQENPPPLKYQRLHPDTIEADLLPYIGSGEEVEVELPSIAQQARFAEIRVIATTSEAVNIIINITSQTSTSEGAVALEFVVPAMHTPFGVYQSFIIPITTSTGETADKLSMRISTYGPEGSVLTELGVRIDNVWMF